MCQSALSNALDLHDLKSSQRQVGAYLLNALKISLFLHEAKPFARSQDLFDHYNQTCNFNYTYMEPIYM